MCIGTPMKIVRCEHGMAMAEGRGQTERLNMLMVGDLPPGTWVLAFQGSALRADQRRRGGTDRRRAGRPGRGAGRRRRHRRPLP